MIFLIGFSIRPSTLSLIGSGRWGGDLFWELEGHLS